MKQNGAQFPVPRNGAVPPLGSPGHSTAAGDRCRGSGGMPGATDPGMADPRTY